MSSTVPFLVDEKLAKITNLFLKKNNELFHLQKISVQSKVSLGTTFRLMKKLVSNGIVEIILVGKTKLYKSNPKIEKNKIKKLVDKKLIGITEVFLKNEKEIFHLKKISEKSKVSIGTTFRLTKKLVKNKFLDIIIVGKTKFYKINKDSLKKFEYLKPQKNTVSKKIYSNNEANKKWGLINN